MSGRHLRAVPNDERTQPITPDSARAVVVALGQRFTLELFDALAALVATHGDDGRPLADLRAIRQNALQVIDYTFDLIEDQAHRKRGAL